MRIKFEKIKKDLYIYDNELSDFKNLWKDVNESNYDKLEEIFNDTLLLRQEFISINSSDMISKIEPIVFDLAERISMCKIELNKKTIESLEFILDQSNFMIINPAIKESIKNLKDSIYGIFTKFEYNPNYKIKKYIQDCEFNIDRNQKVILIYNHLKSEIENQILKINEFEIAKDVLLGDFSEALHIIKHKNNEIINNVEFINSINPKNGFYNVIYDYLEAKKMEIKSRFSPEWVALNSASQSGQSSPA